MDKIRARPAWLWLGLIALLAAGCFRPASLEDQQPTVGSGQSGVNRTALPSATPQSQPARPLALTATLPAATSPAEQPSNDGTEPPAGPAPVTPTLDDEVLLATPTQLPIGPEAEGCTHKLQPGETLFSLARAWGTTVDEIALLNGIPNPNNVAAGTELKKPGCVDSEAAGGEPAATTEGQPSAGGQTYIVQAGDTLFGIANRFGVSLQDLINANPALQANPDQINVGQELTIP